MRLAPWPARSPGTSPPERWSAAPRLADPDPRHPLHRRPGSSARARAQDQVPRDQSAGPRRPSPGPTGWAAAPLQEGGAAGAGAAGAGPGPLPPDAGSARTCCPVAGSVHIRGLTRRLAEHHAELLVPRSKLLAQPGAFPAGPCAVRRRSSPPGATLDGSGNSAPERFPRPWSHAVLPVLKAGIVYSPFSGWHGRRRGVRQQALAEGRHSRPRRRGPGCQPRRRCRPGFAGRPHPAWPAPPCSPPGCRHRSGPNWRCRWRCRSSSPAASRAFWPFDAIRFCWV